jgi:hypothetical protein
MQGQPWRAKMSPLAGESLIPTICAQLAESDLIAWLESAATTTSRKKRAGRIGPRGSTTIVRRHVDSQGDRQRQTAMAGPLA